MIVGLCWAIAAAILLAILTGRRGWRGKTVAMVVALAAPFAVWHAFGSTDGCPTGTRPPDHALFVGYYANEPNPQTGSRGAIYLYLLPPRPSDPLAYRPADTPRSYRVPYSERLQSQLAAAAQATAKGERVGVRVTRRARGRGQGRRLPRWALRLYRLPNPRPPAKEIQL